MEGRINSYSSPVRKLVVFFEIHFLSGWVTPSHVTIQDFILRPMIVR